MGKFAKENGFNIDGEKNEAVLSEILKKGNSFKDKKVSDLIGALEKAGLKKNEQSNVQIQPDEQRQLNKRSELIIGCLLLLGILLQLGGMMF